MPPRKLAEMERKWRTKQKPLRTNYQSRLFYGFAFLPMSLSSAGRFIPFATFLFQLFANCTFQLAPFGFSEMASVQGLNATVSMLGCSQEENVCTAAFSELKGYDWVWLLRPGPCQEDTFRPAGQPICPFKHLCNRLEISIWQPQKTAQM